VIFSTSIHREKTGAATAAKRSKKNDDEKHRASERQGERESDPKQKERELLSSLHTRESAPDTIQQKKLS
jgi:hypothetical protein